MGTTQGPCLPLRKRRKRMSVEKRQRSWLYLRTGCVLNSVAALISPRPLPLRAASRTAYLVSGFRPMIVTMPSMLAVVRIWDRLKENGRG